MSKPEPAKNVRIRDPQTDSTFTAPARELAEGMIRVQPVDESGNPIGDEVFVNAGELKTLSEPVHPPFGPEYQTLWERFSTVFAEVVPRTPEEWEYGFRFDQNPDGEILFWDQVADVFEHFTAGNNVSPDEAKDILTVILSALNNGPDVAKFTTTATTLSEERFREIAHYATHPLEWDVCKSMAEASVIVFEMDGEQSVAFGLEEVKQAQADAVTAINALVLPVPDHPFGVSQLLGLVTAVKGRHDWPTEPPEDGPSGPRGD
jgi:hypothetical protein